MYQELIAAFNPEKLHRNALHVEDTELHSLLKDKTIFLQSKKIDEQFKMLLLHSTLYSHQMSKLTPAQFSFKANGPFIFSI